MKNRIATLALAALMAFTLSACSQGSNNSPNQSSNNPPVGAATSTLEPTPEPIPSYYLDEILLVEPKYYKDGNRELSVESMDANYYGEVTIGSRSYVDGESNDIDETYALFVTDGSNAQINFSFGTYGYYNSFTLTGTASGNTIVYAHNSHYIQYLAEGAIFSASGTFEEMNGLELVQVVWSERKGGSGPDFRMLAAVISEDEAVQYATDGTLPKCLQGLTVTGLDEIFKKPDYEPGALDELEAPATDFKYDIRDDGVTITKYIGNRNKVVIPASIEDLPVTVIGSESFVNYYVETSTLQQVKIPDSVITIKDSVFQDCINLTSVTIGNNVTSIGLSAFSGCISLTSITIPNGVTEIGIGAFNGCARLISIIIPDSVTKIGGLAFSDCTSLTNVTIGSGVTNIGSDAFQSCTGLTSVTIPDSVTVLEHSVFYLCTGLTSVIIGNGVTKLDYQTFYMCTALTSVTIADSVTDIYDGVFEGCTSLDKATKKRIQEITPSYVFN